MDVGNKTRKAMACLQWRNQGGASGGFSPPLAPEKLFTVPSSTSTSDPSSLKLAIAIALQPLLRSKNLNFSSSSHSDAQRWRQKAKERKREIQRLREEFKQLEASLRNLLSSEKESEVIEEMITGLILNMTQRMCTATNEESLASATDADFCVQHLIRKLGDEPFIGQRVVLAVSQKICIQVDSLLLTDPFDDAYLGAHDSMFLMIQLIEFLISDYLSIWTANEDFDWRLLEEWTRSVLQARNALVLLESRNGLYVLFIERVIGEIGKQLGPLQQQGKLNLDILSNLHF